VKFRFVILSCSLLIIAVGLSSCGLFGGGSSGPVTGCFLSNSTSPTMQPNDLGGYQITAQTELNCNGNANNLRVGNDLRVTTTSDTAGLNYPIFPKNLGARFVGQFYLKAFEYQSLIFS
jgi:hypothetical protein